MTDEINGCVFPYIPQGHQCISINHWFVLLSGVPASRAVLARSGSATRMTSMTDHKAWTDSVYLQDASSTLAFQSIQHMQCKEHIEAPLLVLALVVIVAVFLVLPELFQVLWQTRTTSTKRKQTCQSKCQPTSKASVDDSFRWRKLCSHSHGALESLTRSFRPQVWAQMIGQGSESKNHCEVKTVKARKALLLFPLAKARAVGRLSVDQWVAA